MRRSIEAIVVFAVLVVFVSPAGAINISVAEVRNGNAVIHGNNAKKNATITWEGNDVAQSNPGGSFRFTGTVPSDCVGTLSDGVSTIEVALANCEPASGPMGGVLKTGQTLCVDSTGPIDCAGTGQDGDIQAGVALPIPRYTDNGDGTITDNTTGLRWLKDVACLGNHTWTEAFNLVASLNSGTELSCTDYVPGTFSDWRMPNIKELYSLINYGFFLPAISNAQGNAKWSEGDPFVNLPVLVGGSAVFILSSTPVSQDAPNAASIWGVQLAFGQIDVISGNFLRPVWPVRGPE